MAELRVIEEIAKPKKVQVQIKDSNYSKSFTIYGMDVDYLFQQYFTITKKIAESPFNNIKIICYKPPK